MRSFYFDYTSKTNTGYLKFTYTNSLSLINIEKQEVVSVVSLPGGMSFTAIDKDESTYGISGHRVFFVDFLNNL
jgi:hypothetical protein